MKRSYFMGSGAGAAPQEFLRSQQEYTRVTFFQLGTVPVPAPSQGVPVPAHQPLQGLGTQDMSTGTRGHQDPRTLGHWGHCGSGKGGHQTLGHGDTSPGNPGDTGWVPDPLGISAPAPGSSPSPPIFIPFYQKQKEKQLWNQNTEKQQAYV